MGHGNSYQSHTVETSRDQLIEEAARILEQDGIRDFEQAKRKAAKRLGIRERDLPSNVEIEQALAARLNLFDNAGQQQRLQTLRGVAADAMQFLDDFKPALVGDVLSGVVTSHSVIQLHLHAETLEDVLMFLSDANVPYELQDVLLRTGKHSKPTSFPCLLISADGQELELLVLRHDKPTTLFCPIQLKPTQRATRSQLLAIINKEKNPA